jgi:hypothetical protein
VIPPPPISPRALLTAAILLVALAASGAPAASAADPCTPMSLRPALTSPQAGDLYLRAGTATCDSIEIELTAHDVARLFTVSFDLAYPADLLKYEGYSEGPVLVQGPPRQAPFFLVQNPSPGILLASMTRMAPDTSVAASGSAGILRLRFRKVASGTGTVDFLSGDTSAISERVVDSQGQIVATRWTPGHGATVVVP